MSGYTEAVIRLRQRDTSRRLDSKTWLEPEERVDPEEVYEWVWRAVCREVKANPAGMLWVGSWREYYHDPPEQWIQQLYTTGEWQQVSYHKMRERWGLTVLAAHAPLYAAGRHKHSLLMIVELNRLLADWPVPSVPPAYPDLSPVYPDLPDFTLTESTYRG